MAVFKPFVSTTKKKERKKETASCILRLGLYHRQPEKLAGLFILERTLYEVENPKS
jgi:hypothetical protein